jgi:hypothetical protein
LADGVCLISLKKARLLDRPMNEKPRLKKIAGPEEIATKTTDLFACLSTTDN